MNALTLMTTSLQTMSSKDIAELTGKEHKNVLSDIRNMLEQLGCGTAEFSAVYKDQQLIPRPCFNLPKRETLILVSGYSVDVRAKIIDRWQELEGATPALLPSQIAHTFISAELSMASLFGVPLHLAQVEAVKTAKAQIGYDATRFLLMAPAQDDIQIDEQRLEVTEIGKMFGMTAVKVNKALEAAGLQVKMPLGWDATGEGKMYSTLHQWASGSKSGYNLKWQVSRIRNILTEAMAKAVK